jgi:hypothetical protein
MEGDIKPAFEEINLFKNYQINTLAGSISYLIRKLWK